MGVAYNPSIVREGLSFIYDYANVKSYPGSGTTVYNLNGGNNATLSGNAAFNSTSKYMSFDGTNGSYLTEQTGGLGSHGTNSFTYQFLVRPNSSTSSDSAGEARIYEQTGYPSTYHILRVILSGGSSYFQFIGYPTGGSDYSVTSAAITLSQWYFVTCVIDRSSNKCRLYVNNTKSEAALSASGNIGSSSVLRFPSSYAEISADYSAILCYNKALTDSEVARNFNALRGRFGL